MQKNTKDAEKWKKGNAKVVSPSPRPQVSIKLMHNYGEEIY